MSNIVYVGLWNNHDLGSVFGKVLTIPYRTGAILVTLLAILVTLAANRSWKIWRFLLHISLDTLRRRLHIQDHFSIRKQQAILRNSETAGGALLSLLEVSRANKSTKSATPTRNIFPVLLLFALLHWVGFIALGILTTKVNIGSVVRSAKTDDCGIWLPLGLLNQDWTYDKPMMTATELGLNTTIAAENYVRNCYVTESASIADCNVYVQRKISHTTELVPCPFRDPSVCLGPKTDALAMDSGNISLSDLGINWQSAADISVRRRSVCTPIVTEPFLYSREASLTYTQQFSGVDPAIAQAKLPQAYSFTVDESGTNMTFGFLRTDIIGEYDVGVVQAKNGSFTIEPLKPRELSPAVTVVTIRGRSVTFPTPSDDAVFYAHQNSTVHFKVGSQNVTLTTYMMDRPLNAMVCQDMAMVCSNITGYCSGWIAPGDLSTNATYTKKLLGSLSADYNAVIALSIAAIPLGASTTYNGLNGRGVSALQATRHLQVNMQYMISKEQWKIEAEQWFRISLAILQMGPHRIISTPEVDKSRVENVIGIDGAAVCSAIKFRSTKHVTLSVFGILIIVVLSVVVTLISYLDGVLNWLAPKLLSSILQPWERNGYLHLVEHSEMANST